MASLTAEAIRILEANRRGDWTAPAPAVYPHQWLWDSCFIAIGLARQDPTRAATEIAALFRGQWQNGMLPHIIFSASHGYWEGPDYWQSDRIAGAPSGLATSGLTQPPVVALAAWRVAEAMAAEKRVEWIAPLWPKLLAFHRWLYRERNPDGTGLIVLFHPWESGLDTTPPWMQLLSHRRLPLWIQLLQWAQISRLLPLFRRDTRRIPAGERPTDTDAIKMFNLARVYRSRHFDSQKLLDRPILAVQDLSFNSILIAANRALFQIGELIGQTIPEDLQAAARSTEQNLNQLWHEDDQQYYSRDFITGQLVRVPSIAALFPLLTNPGVDRANQLRRLLLNPASYWPSWPVPSVPLNSVDFNRRRYWQGPTWINTNWLLIQGLQRCGFSSEAAALTLKTRQLVEKSGFREYFSPLDGSGFGASDFSWTAALYLDLASD